MRRYCPPRQLANFSQNEEIRVALEHTRARCIAEANPNDQVWGTGWNAYDLLASFPT